MAMSDIFEDDDAESVEIWRALKLQDQERRAANRETGPLILAEHGVEFVSKNNGAHLIIGKPAVVNFWPGTQRWTAVRNSSVNGRGAKGLIDWLRKNHPSLLKGEKA